MEANKPEIDFSTGAIRATVWKNQAKEAGEFYRTINLERRYKDKDGAWKSTNTFRVNDLPKVSLVMQKAYEHIVLNEAGNAS